MDRFGKEHRLVLFLLFLSTLLQSSHCDTWAVIASSSRFWLNYRHTTNALEIYNAVKRLGIPDSHIVLMLADCSACDPRNSFPGRVYSQQPHSPPPVPDTKNLSPPLLQVDYRDRDVNLESVLHVLSGNHPPGTPPSRRLDSTSNSSVLLFFTGHGGDGFLKFHDQNELLATDIAHAVASMHRNKRYKELLIIADTCQAATLYSEIANVPGWAGIASSPLGQSSYALRSDATVGAHLVDEFSHHVATFLNSIKEGDESPRFRDLLRFVKSQKMSSSIDVNDANLGRALGDVKVTDFFGSGGALGDQPTGGWVMSHHDKNDHRMFHSSGTPENEDTKGICSAVSSSLRCDDGHDDCGVNMLPTIRDILVHALSPHH